MVQRRRTRGNGTRLVLAMAGALGICLVAMESDARTAGHKYPGPAWAEADPYWYDETFRVLRFRRAWTTSNCIGWPRTPRCAAETLLAGWLRRNVWLCQRVGREPSFAPDPSPREGVWGSRMLAYHTTYEDRLSVDEIPDGYRDPPHNWRPGDVAVRMNVFSCKGTAHCLDTGEGSRTGAIRDCPPVRCATGGPGALDGDVANPRITIARRAGNHWHVVDVVTGDDHFPDGFWPTPEDER